MPNLWWTIYEKIKLNKIAYAVEILLCKALLSFNVSSIKLPDCFSVASTGTARRHCIFSFPLPECCPSSYQLHSLCWNHALHSLEMGKGINVSFCWKSRSLSGSRMKVNLDLDRDMTITGNMTVQGITV